MKTLWLFGLLFFLSSCSSINSTDKNVLSKVLQKEGKWSQKDLGGASTIHFLSESEVSQDIDTISQKTEAGIVKAKNFIGEEYNRPIHVVTVDDRATIQKLLSRQSDGIAFPASNLVVEVFGVAQSCHEKFHVLSINLWGMPKLWIGEGMAVACDDQWWGTDLHALAHYLVLEEKLDPLSVLFKSDSSFRKSDSRFSYPQLGSVVKFIDERYGRDKLLQIWRTNNIESSIGITINELEMEWKEELKKHAQEDIDYLERINYKAK